MPLNIANTQLDSSRFVPRGIPQTSSMIIIKIGVKIKLIFANELILPSKAKYAKIIVTIITIQLLTSKTLEIATLPASIDEVIIKTLNKKRKLIILPPLPKYLIINF
jgi:hypothetical protein